MLRKVNLGGLYNSITQHIDLYSIIVEVNLKARGFTEFTRLTLQQHI